LLRVDLRRARAVEMRLPGELQLPDVLRGDLLERRVALVRDAAAVRDPVVPGRRGQLTRAERGGLGNGDSLVPRSVPDAGCHGRDAHRKGHDDDDDEGNATTSHEILLRPAQLCRASPRLMSHRAGGRQYDG